MSSGPTTDPTGPAAPAVIVGRQPIVDRDGTVVAFELLYRARHADMTPVSGQEMTAHVLVGAVTIGVDQLVGSRSMFCNADRAVLLSDIPVTLPPDRTVIELLETVEIDDEVVEACRALVAAGFRLALDDFVWVEGAERVLELASVVKIDVQAAGREQVLELAERCRAYDVLLLAEKVETDADVAWAHEHGFDLFQGYAIERPALVHGRSVGTSLLSQARLAASLLTEDLDLEEIEEILRHEPGLVVQLLQLASVGTRRGMRRRVHTVHEAMVLLGTTRIRQWMALTLLDTGGVSTPDGLATALSRARMAELLALARGHEDPELAFTAGLLSALDLLLGVPVAELAATMDLSPDLKAAAFDRTGTVGCLVGEIIAYEEAVHSAVPRPRDAVAEELDAAAGAAFAWAMPYVSSLAAA